MTELKNKRNTKGEMRGGAPETWAPPVAPMDMPVQDLAPHFRLFDPGHLLRLILPGRHT